MQRTLPSAETAFRNDRMSILRLGLLILVCAGCGRAAVDPQRSERAGGTRTTSNDLTLLGRARVSAIYDVEVMPPYAYVLERGILRVLDVRDPRNVREAASLELPRAHVRMALRHPYLYLTGFGAPLAIADISKPLQPRWVGELPEFAGARNDVFELGEDVAYLVTLLDPNADPAAPAGASLALDVLDLSEPERPHRLARLDLGVRVRGEYGGIARLGSQVFVVVAAPLTETGRSQLISIDARAPDRPAIAGRTELPDGLRVVDIEPAGGRLYALYGGPRASEQGLAVFDLGAAGEVELLGCVTDARFWMPIDLIVRGDAVFVTFKGKVKLATFDVSDPRRPRLAEAYETEEPFVAGLGFTLVADRLYIASDGGPMPIFDVAEPSKPRLLGHWPFEGGWVTDVVVDDGLALLSNGWAGMLTYDVTDPRAPRRLARYYIPEVAADPWVVVAARSGDRLLLTHAGQLAELIDFSDPAAPRSVMRFDPGGRVLAALFRDGIAILGGTPQTPGSDAGGAGWLAVMRIGDDGHVPLAELSLPEAVVDLAYLAELAIAVHPDGAVTVIDPAYPTRPRVSGTVGGESHGDEQAPASLETRASRIAAGPGGKTIYVATVTSDAAGDGQLGLSVIAVDPSGKPVLLGRALLGAADWPAPVVAAQGDRVLVGVERRLVSVDLGDPVRPAVLADRQMATSVEGLAITGGQVFVGAGEDGLWIFQQPPELRRR